MCHVSYPTRKGTSIPALRIPGEGGGVVTWQEVAAWHRKSDMNEELCDNNCKKIQKTPKSQTKKIQSVAWHIANMAPPGCLISKRSCRKEYRPEKIPKNWWIKVHKSLVLNWYPRWFWPIWKIWVQLDHFQRYWFFKKMAWNHHLVPQFWAMPMQLSKSHDREPTELDSRPASSQEPACPSMIIWNMEDQFEHIQ